MLKEMLVGDVFGIPLSNLVTSLIIIIAFFVVGKILYFIFRGWGRKLTGKTKNKFDDILLETIEKPIVFLVLIAGLYFGWNVLGIVNETLNLWAIQIIVLLIILILTWFAIRLVDAVIQGLLKPLTTKTKSQLDDQLLPMLSRFFKLAIILIAGIIVLDRFGIDVTALIAGVGIGGLAIAFAAKETIANIFGGISLLIDKSFKVGDKIKLESGEVGIVSDISLRSTRIKTYSNEMLIIPNAQLANSRLLNYVQPDKKARVNVSFGVSYGSNVKKVEEIALKSVKKVKAFIPEPPPFINFEEMADFSLKFKVFFWVGDYNKAVGSKWEATKILYEDLTKAKIEIPFPITTVHLKKK